MIGQLWSDIFPQPEQHARDKQMTHVISEGIEWNARVPVLDLKKGGARLYDVKAYPVRAGRRAQDSITSVVVYMHEVTEEVMTFLSLIDCNRELQLIKESLEEQTCALDSANRMLKQSYSELQDENARLNVLAVVDVMTGLPNYRAFNERLHTETKHAVLSGRPLSLLIFDVDNFKQYNDQFGHPQGDELLRQIAMVLRDNIRATDFPARYGGEEFAVLLPRTDKFGAVVVAERLRSKIAAYPMPNRLTTVSLGIAEFPSDCQGVDEIVAKADKAMYVAKSYGKNTTCLWSRDQHSSLNQDNGSVFGGQKDEECVPVLSTQAVRTIAPDSRRILVVDKDEMVSATIREALQDNGYTVVTSPTGRVALSKIAEGGGMYDAILTEVALPDRTGFELREQAQVLQPGIPVVFMSTLAHKDWSRKTGRYY